MGSREDLSSDASAARARAEIPEPAVEEVQRRLLHFRARIPQAADEQFHPVLVQHRLQNRGFASRRGARVLAAVPRSCSSFAPVMIVTRLAVVSGLANLAAHSPPCDTMFSIVFTA